MGSKRRHNTHHRRQAATPALIDCQMTNAAHPGLALQLRLSIISLIERSTIASCNQLSLQLTRIAGGMSHANHGQPILNRTDAGSIAIKSAIMAVESIVARHDRTGAVAVDEYEKMALESAAGRLDDVLGRIPSSAYARACREIDVYLRVKD